MKYLRIENDSFGFVVDGIHDILDTDVLITDEDYQEFMTRQSSGVNFRLKDLNNENMSGLFDYVEEFTPEVPELDQPDRVKELEDSLAVIQEDLAITQDAVDFLLMSKMDISIYNSDTTKGGVTTMAAYFVKRIMKEALTYKEVIAKYPEYKEDIDFILKAEGKGDLITQ